MSDLDLYFLNATRHWCQDERFCVAVSGGVDSMVLTHMMHTHFKNIVVFTFDHGLRPDSKQDVAFVRSFCEDLGIEIHSDTWLSPLRKRLHEHARIARYAAMENFCTRHHCRFLVSGHHLDDQTETIVMRFLKGSGPMGLRGMMASKPISNDVTLLRPFLTIPQSMILEYAKGHSIPYIIDSSNAYEQFWRGCYRQHKEVLKKLGLSSHHILHMRHQMIEMTDFVWEQVEDAEHRIVTIHHHEYSFCSCKFTALPKIIQHKLMQKIIQNMSGFQYPPSYQFIQKLVHDMVRHDDFKTVSIQTCLISKRKDIFVVSLSSKDDKRRQKQKNTTN